MWDEITVLFFFFSFSFPGGLHRQHIWTSLQPNTQGSPTQVPVQPCSPETQAWMGRLRSIHQFCEFIVLFLFKPDPYRIKRQRSHSLDENWGLSRVTIDVGCSCWSGSFFEHTKPMILGTCDTPQIIYRLEKQSEWYTIKKTKKKTDRSATVVAIRRVHYDCSPLWGCN